MPHRSYAFALVALVALVPLACAEAPAARGPVAVGQSDLYADAGSGTVAVTPASSDAGPAATSALTSAPVDGGAAQAGGEHIDLARRKFGTRDGAGCLAELDAYDRGEARPQYKTTDPGASYAMMRAQCMMLAGDCDGGKALMQRALTANNSTGQSQQMLMRSTEGSASMYCVGDKLSPRDQVLRASNELTQAAAGSKQVDSATCRRDYELVKRLGPQLPGGSEDQAKKAEAGLLWSAPNCFGRAGDCAAALASYRAELEPKMSVKDPAVREKAIQNGFPDHVPSCKKN